MNVIDRVFADHHNARHLACNFALHLHKRIPATNGFALPPSWRVFHLELAIFGNGVVQGHDCWNDFFNLEDAISEALIVMHDVEIVDACFESAMGSDAERAWLAKRAFKKLC
ncbi:unannotated protein [freshwater metagenome]|uniref:Unannotated protein n=1 Tax=freshwater metagenome TaxID=449393 RepID=A0A6J6XZJ2_9ZZZZ